MRCFTLTPMMGRAIASTSCGATPSRISTMAHPPLTAPGATPKNLTSGLHQVAADKITPELVGGMHYGEAASGGIDDEVAGVGDGADQSGDQADWLDVRMDAAVDFFRPAIGNAVITPCAFRSKRRLLQH